MKKQIILISCGARKTKTAQKARDLYIGTYFRKMLKYAEYLSKKSGAKIYILSAKYGLVELNEVIEPYESTLNGKSEKYKKRWARQVIE